MQILPVRNPEELQIAVTKSKEVLQSGGVILYPTDTLYGLGADAFSDDAVDTVYKIKGRDDHKPIHAIFADLKSVEEYAEVNPLAHALAERFLPGPLTLVLKKKKKIKKGVGRHIETIGVRIPDNEFCRLLAHEFGPFTTTSANVAGLLPERSMGKILAQLSASLQMIDLVIDAGELPVRPASTVVDVTESTIKILREGAISKEAIESVVH